MIFGYSSTRSFLMAGSIFFVLLASSCKKLIEIDRPAGNVDTQVIFETDEKAATAVAGVFSTMINQGDVPNFYNGYFDVYATLLSDDGQLTAQGVGFNMQPYYDGHLIRTDPVTLNIWSNAYKVIYGANGVLQGISASTATAFTTEARNRYSGEMYFARAYSYFYLVNTFGDVPLVTSTDINQNISVARAPVAEVYKLIESDLKKALELLPAIPGTNRSHPDKYAAAALLARTYLYLQRWDEAKVQADTVINSGKFILEDPAKTFKKGSQEAIWSLHFSPVAEQVALYDATCFVPYLNKENLPSEQFEMFTDPDFFNFLNDNGYALPAVTLQPGFMATLAAQDFRKSVWIGYVPVPNVEPYNGVTRYYPYKVMRRDAKGDFSDMDRTMLRLGEIYLIRAEANAHGSNPGAALADLNAIRSRAGLEPVAASQNILDTIAAERRIELFAEGGHRWFDLKRTGKASGILGALSYKQPWSDHTLVLPIPDDEIARDPLIKQNPDY